MSDEPELIIEVTGGVALTTLNRPKALNALTEAMVSEFGDLLRQWAADPAITAVIVKGAGEKGFCAGGDIRKLYDAKATGTVSTDFFRTEYTMNSLINHFPKPYVAILNGITMGGGVGISAPGQYRIATDRLMWAMPETGIGLFPDVGGSYFLPRLPGKIGLYLGLTGYRMKAADAVYTGIATHYVPIDQVDAFIAAVTADADVEAALWKFASDPGEAPLATRRADIDRLFSGNSVEAILADLATDGSEWATSTRDTLLKMSPTSLKLAFAAYQRSEGLSFDEVMKMEFRVVSHLMDGHDFYEGVRALLVDRDNSPKWSPATVADVSDQTIDGYFKPLDTRELSL